MPDAVSARWAASVACFNVDAGRTGSPRATTPWSVSATSWPPTLAPPMVNVASAERVMAMVADTVAKGARVALEPVRKGAVVPPDNLVGARRTSLPL